MIKIKTLLKYAIRPEYFIKALLHPKRIIEFLRKDYIFDLEEFIISLIEEDKKEIGEYIKEIKRNKKISRDILEKEKNFQKQLSAYNNLTGGGVAEDPACILYTLVRLLRPKVVVETGVSSGVSSTFILAALAKNEEGNLISVDLPCELGKEFSDVFVGTNARAVIPEGKKPGWLIPDNLRKRWKIVLGRSSDKLKPILEQIRSVDIFLHDSEHSYENMLWEYRTVWPFLREGGILLSHDVGWNHAFDNFCREVNRKGTKHRRGFGGIKK